MPGLHVDFSDEDYARIPAPKRTWVKRMVLGALNGVFNGEEGSVNGDEIGLVVHTGKVGHKPKTTTDPRPQPQEFFFRIRGQVQSAFGMTPAEAAKVLGIGLTTKWYTAEEARAEGLVVDDPMGGV